MSVSIAGLLGSGAIIADLKGGGKEEVLAELVDALVAANPALVRDEVIGALLERERLGSTGIGDGVAIPHGKLKNLEHQLVAFGLSRRGVDFDAMDGKPARFFFLLVAPEDAVALHLKTLARISKLLKEQQVRDRLQGAMGREEIHRIIAEEEVRL